MPAFVVFGPFSALVPGKGATVVAGPNEIALFRIDDVVYAMEASCLRCGAALAEGYLQGRMLGCPGCDWRYDVPTGAVLGLPELRLQAFDTRVIDGQIVVADA